jgi:hypothetical protein
MCIFHFGDTITCPIIIGDIPESTENNYGAVRKKVSKTGRRVLPLA